MTLISAFKKIYLILKELTQNFGLLIFPDICILCSNLLVNQENYICSHCHLALPKVLLQNNMDNELKQRFWGRVNLHFCSAYLTFRKGGIVQKLLFQIKYQERKEVATIIGQMYGIDLLKSGQKFDLIIPVPLDCKKLKQRGYNQSEYFGLGLAKVLGIPVFNLIERVNNFGSQTNKSRLRRWENVKESFIINSSNNNLDNAHVLLVDDVITTGATIEACAEVLLKSGIGKLSIVAIAYAK